MSCAALTRDSSQMRNERYYSGGQWSLHGNYMLPEVSLCVANAARSSEVVESVREYVVPALLSAYGQPTTGKVEELELGHPICELAHEAEKDDLKIAPSMKATLAKQVQLRQVGGFILPIVFIAATENEHALRDEHGRVIVSEGTGKYTANGNLYLYVLYVNDVGDIVHLSTQPYRQDSYYASQAIERLRSKLKDGLADELVRDLKHNAPPVSVVAAK